MKSRLHGYPRTCSNLDPEMEKIQTQQVEGQTLPRSSVLITGKTAELLEQPGIEKKLSDRVERMKVGQGGP